MLANDKDEEDGHNDVCGIWRFVAGKLKFEISSSNC